ncbi:hypothetical protein MINTM005_17370 [Mycobacterium intracellulare]|nr:hypothetical protein MINTM005_17370 [Mycobacterium intracellulare]
MAAESNSAANRFQAHAAAIIEAEPGPEYMRSEWISGGNAPKSSTSHPPQLDAAALMASVAAYEPAPKCSILTKLS